MGFLQFFYALILAIPLRKIRKCSESCICLLRMFSCIAANKLRWEPNIGKYVRKWDQEDYCDETPLDYGELEFSYVEDFACGKAGPRTMYQTVFDEGKAFHDHGSVPFVLAEACRMQMTIASRSTYEETKINYYLKTGKGGPAFGLLHRMMQKRLHTILLAGVFENSLQLNMQLSLFAMNFYIQKEVNWQLLVSVFLTYGVVGRNLWDAFCLEAFVWRMLRDSNIDSKDILRKRFVTMTFSLFIYLGLIGYATLKFCMAFACDDRMFNITGCVVVKSIHSCARS